MKWFYTCLIIFISLLIISCGDDPDPEPENTIPECIMSKIDEFKDDQGACEEASVKKYMFQEQEVYVFTQGICISDGGSDVLLADCSSLCFLGGIAGTQDCNGDFFFDVAEELETLWQF